MKFAPLSFTVLPSATSGIETSRYCGEKHAHPRRHTLQGRQSWKFRRRGPKSLLLFSLATSQTWSLLLTCSSWCPTSALPAWHQSLEAWCRHPKHKTSLTTCTPLVGPLPGSWFVPKQLGPLWWDLCLGLDACLTNLDPSGARVRVQSKKSRERHPRKTIALFPLRREIRGDVSLFRGTIVQPPWLKKSFYLKKAIFYMGK